MKNKKLFAGIALLAGAVLGGQSAFAATSSTAANPANGQTDVHSVLRAPDATGTPLPDAPTGSEQPGGGTTGGSATSNFQFAAIPSGPWHFEGNLSATGNTDIEARTASAGGGSVVNETHVSVLDKTHETHGWTVKAQLNWTGSTGNPGTGVKLLANLADVQEYDEGTSAYVPTTISNFNTAYGTNIAGVGSNAVEIGNSAAPIWEAPTGNVYNKAYDLKLENIKLRVPTGVAANSYDGNVAWTLELLP